MKTVYHLDLDQEKIKGAKIALLPGDPDRVASIAKGFDPESREIACKREYRTCLGRMNGQSILITSTGIGGPSTSIAVDELACLGLKTFIRVGTTGAIQKDIKIGDVVITSGSVRLDGASTHYAPLEYPAVANYKIINAMVEAAKRAKVNYHVGITASSDTFYPGQEHPGCSEYVIKRFQGSMREWQRLNVLNYEMESATLLTVASVLGLKAGCVTGVIGNRTQDEHITKESLRCGEENVIKVGIEALRILTKSLRPVQSTVKWVL
ncbi:uridine phosphorylase [bacterium]|nr:uridine phosphorylase [bacterium]